MNAETGHVNTHLWVRESANVDWGVAGQSVTHNRVELSAKVFYKTGQTSTHLLVDGSPYKLGTAAHLTTHT